MTASHAKFEGKKNSNRLNLFFYLCLLCAPGHSRTNTTIILSYHRKPNFFSGLSRPSRGRCIHLKINLLQQWLYWMFRIFFFSQDFPKMENVPCDSRFERKEDEKKTILIYGIGFQVKTIQAKCYWYYNNKWKIYYEANRVAGNHISISRNQHLKSGIAHASFPYTKNERNNNNNNNTVCFYIRCIKIHLGCFLLYCRSSLCVCVCALVLPFV